MKNNISDRFTSTTNLIIDTYRECIDANKTIEKSEVYSYLEGAYRVADIKYWVPIVWKILYSLNNDVDYSRHKNARISLILCIKQYELLFSEDLQKFIYTIDTNDNCLEHNDDKSNMAELDDGKVDWLGLDDVDSNWLRSDDVDSNLLEWDDDKSNWSGSDDIDTNCLGSDGVEINLLGLDDIDKSRKSASINYPLYESLNNAIIQYKRRVEKPLDNSYELNITRNDFDPLTIEEIKPIDNKIYNNLISPASIDKISDNLFENYRNYFFERSHNKDGIEYCNESLASLIKCIMWNRISIIFFTVIIIIFIIDYNNHDNPPSLKCEPSQYNIFKSKLRIKDKDDINNILYFCDKIDNIVTNLSSSNKEELYKSIKNRISLKGFIELYNSNIDIQPYCNFPVFDYEHISKILCNKLNYSNNLQPYILKYLKTSGSKLTATSLPKNTFKTVTTSKIIAERNSIPKLPVNIITTKGIIPKIPTKKTLSKQLRAISRLCNFETYSKYNTKCDFSKLEIKALKTLKIAFQYEKDFTYDTFKDIFEPMELNSINELLIYELLQINLKDRRLNKLLMDLYGINFRDTLMSIKHETLERFSDYDTPITDTYYTITKVKFANVLIKNFKAKDCQNFLGDIRNFDELTFKVFIKDFCHSQNIDYPYFKDDSEFLKYVFSTVLDLSIIELEHEFNKFWQYDFSMSYCKKSDIKSNSVLKGVYRNSKK